MHTDLPTHPTTGLRALGVLPSGRIVWPIMGGDGTGEGSPGNESGQGSGPGEGPAQGERTFTQSELEAIIGDRLARERQKYGDYDDVKTKAAELDRIREAEKTDLEKLQGQYEELLGQHSRTERELRISRAITKHGLDQEDAEFLTGDTDEEVDAKAAKLAARTAAKPGDGTGEGNNDPGSHRRPDPSQGQGSAGEGANTLAAGADRYRRTKTTTS